MNDKRQRIGLALSGGGFRASIFHLGVIRRLEELEIMKDVTVLSTVSGGSIIGAYYACEMEQRLRNLDENEQHDPKTRIRLWAEIAQDFLAATDQNLRTRALVFAPFYHPLLFVKTLLLRTFRAGARAELIQKEYDRWFFKNNTLDQLPTVTPDQVKVKSNVLAGPKLVINTTSLLTGERVPFSREAVSGLSELSKVDKNVLPLSKVVGASAGVPVLFPPTSISGNLLVDGGLSDNQGIEGLLAEGCNVLLISDGSGQLEQLDTINTGEISIYGRTNAILQHQVRDKLIQLVLARWEGGRAVSGDPEARELGPKSGGLEPPPMRFALVHLFRNLKDREDVTERVSSEFIPAIGRIRTDLDQFSYIEREALIYHGYTLIDAQLRSHCKHFLAELFGPWESTDPYPADKLPEMRCAPLFREGVQRNESARLAIRNDLHAGHQKLYLLRAMEKHPGHKILNIRVGGPTHWTLGLFAAFAVGGLVATLSQTQLPLIKCKEWIDHLITGVIPVAVQNGINQVLDSLKMPEFTPTISGISGIAAILLMLGLYLYLAAFPAYAIVRRITVRLDRRLYTGMTNEDPGVNWDTPRQQPKGGGPKTQAAAAGAERS